MNLHNYNIIIINSSGGKDSLCAIWEVVRLAKLQAYPFDHIVISHQDLGRMEWKGTKELVQQQADFFGLKCFYSKRRDKNGKEETLLEYVKRRGKWPSNKQRFCTSDFKRGPGARIVTSLTKSEMMIKALYVFGFRKEESPARSKKKMFKLNTNLTTRNRKVYDWLPIHNWTLAKVWFIIRAHHLPYHGAYDLGMSRLSCIICIFCPFDELVIAGRANPELLNEYIDTEIEIDHTFRDGFSLTEVKKAIENNYVPKPTKSWVM